MLGLEDLGDDFDDIAVVWTLNEGSGIGMSKGQQGMFGVSVGGSGRKQRRIKSKRNSQGNGEQSHAICLLKVPRSVGREQHKIVRVVCHIVEKGQIPGLPRGV